VKSAAEIPDTDSEKEIPNVNDMADAGDEGVDEKDAVGASTSMFIVAAAVFPPGPFRELLLPKTASCSMVTITVPVV
jgi:hypothetical protein